MPENKETMATYEAKDKIHEEILAHSSNAAEDILSAFLTSLACSLVISRFAICATGSVAVVDKAEMLSVPTNSVDVLPWDSPLCCCVPCSSPLWRFCLLVCVWAGDGDDGGDVCTGDAGADDGSGVDVMPVEVMACRP
jgi:hypothetical protein